MQGMSPTEPFYHNRSRMGLKLGHQVGVLVVNLSCQLEDSLTIGEVGLGQRFRELSLSSNGGREV